MSARASARHVPFRAFSDVREASNGNAPRSNRGAFPACELCQRLTIVKEIVLALEALFAASVALSVA